MEENLFICKTCGERLTWKEGWWYFKKKKEYHHIDCIKNNKKYIEQYEKEKGAVQRLPLGFCPEAEYKRKGCKVPPIECDPKKKSSRMDLDPKNKRSTRRWTGADENN